MGAQFRLFESAAGIDVVRARHLDLTGRAVPGAGQRPDRRFTVENIDLPALLAYRRSGYTTPHAKGASKLPHDIDPKMNKGAPAKTGDKMPVIIPPGSPGGMITGILSPVFAGAPLFILGSMSWGGFNTPSFSSSFLLNGTPDDLSPGVGAASGLAFSAADGGGVWANDVADQAATRARAKIGRNKILA